MITAYIDFKSPGAYLALAPTLALARRMAVSIDWRPFRTLDRDIPAEGVNTVLAETHHRVRAQALRATHQLYAQLRGMTLSFPAENTSTDLALGVLCELSGDPLDYVSAAYAAYWERHLDLDEPDVVAGIIKESGAQHSGDFSSAAAALDAAQQAAERAGIVDAPGFVVDGQVFIGRQHFPWIEEILGAARTPAETP